MTINRRRFVQSSLLAGIGLMMFPAKTFGIKNASSCLNPSFCTSEFQCSFCHANKYQFETNSSAIKDAGLNFGRSIFNLTDDAVNGIPLTHKVVIKPNLTCRDRTHVGYTAEKSMGIVTDAFFVEGVIESLKELGLALGSFMSEK